MFEKDLVLTASLVRLEPLQIHHIPDLMEIAVRNQDEFGHTFVPMTVKQGDEYFTEVLMLRREKLAYPFVKIVDNKIIGTTRFTDIDWHNKTLGIGYTWFDKAYYGTAVNAQSKYLLFKHVFEEMGFMRIQIRVDSLNQRSRRAVKALGTTLEGILRNHKIAAGGRIRHTALYSIVDSEWPAAKPILEKRIEKKLAGKK